MIFRSDSDERWGFAGKRKRSSAIACETPDELRKVIALLGIPAWWVREGCCPVWAEHQAKIEGMSPIKVETEMLARIGRESIRNRGRKWLDYHALGLSCTPPPDDSIDTMVEWIVRDVTRWPGDDARSAWMRYWGRALRDDWYRALGRAKKAGLIVHLGRGRYVPAGYETYDEEPCEA